MYTEKVHSPVVPKETEICTLPGSGLNEVWLRKNIQKTTAAHFEGDSGESGESLEYVYDEVYFQTAATKEEIEADINSFWLEGQEWKPEVPLTMEQKQEMRIAALESQLETAKAELEQSRTDNDMAIAELTMVMAAMMGGE